MNTKTAEPEMSKPVKSDSVQPAALKVNGRVGTPLTLAVADILKMEAEEFKELFIVCGTGEPRDTIKSCKGVLLEKIIQRADVLKEGHNDTKKMFIVATGDDGYKVLFSWQEIFNTAIGGGVAVLTERDGHPLDERRERIDLISAQDYYAGSRYVRDLRKIDLVLFQ